MHLPPITSHAVHPLTFFFADPPSWFVPHSQLTEAACARWQLSSASRIYDTTARWRGLCLRGGGLQILLPAGDCITTLFKRGWGTVSYSCVELSTLRWVGSVYCFYGALSLVCQEYASIHGLELQRSNDIR